MTDRFKSEHHVKSTPQTFVDGERVGGPTTSSAISARRQTVQTP